MLRLACAATNLHDVVERRDGVNRCPTTRTRLSLGPPRRGCMVSNEPRARHVPADALALWRRQGVREVPGSAHERREPGSEPRAGDVYLYVTLTDLQGCDVPLRLHDAARRMSERRHRTVIHFRVDRAHGRDDFDEHHNPLLASAAPRRSSSTSTATAATSTWPPSPPPSPRARRPASPSTSPAGPSTCPP